MICTKKSRTEERKERESVNWMTQSGETAQEVLNRWHREFMSGEMSERDYARKTGCIPWVDQP